MNIGLVLSGGTGSRLGGDVPKQYLKVNDRTILSYSVETLSLSDYIDAIWIVAAPEYQESIRQDLVDYDIKGKLKGFSAPGKTRQLSIVNGLQDVLTMAEEDDFVLIHDAARPLLSAGMIAGCFAQVEGHDGVLPVLPMKDTVYLSEDGKSITGLLERSQVFAGQAPELFVLGKYLKANLKLIENGEIEKINGSSEPAVMAKMDIVTVPGEESNIKITTPEDLERFREMIKR